MSRGRTLWDFVKVRKKWWLVPLIIWLGIVALLIILNKILEPTYFIRPHGVLRESTFSQSSIEDRRGLKSQG